MSNIVQYTLLSTLFFLVWRLIATGVYPDPAMDPTAANNHPKYRSNVSLDWEEVKDNYTFSISDSDSAMLAKEVSLPKNEFLFQAMMSGDFPNLEQARESVESRTDVYFGTKVQYNATARCSVKLCDSNANTDVQISTDAAEVRDIKK